MNCPYPVRVCTKCKRILIAHEINFRRNSKKNNKFRASCIKCEKEYYENNKDNIKKKRKERYKNNKEKENKRNKEYYENHKDDIKIYQKQYREDNKKHISESKKIWNKNNPDKLFNSHCKRRIKEESQGNGFTKEQWFEMMNFFNWECAYSGIQLTKEDRSIDHVVALDNDGENEIWNCVPMYTNYNSSKKVKDILEWYMQQPFFSIDRLTKIYEWRIYAYEKWGNEI